MSSKQLILPGMSPSPPKPKLGEVRKGRDIGKSQLRGSFIWAACPNCGNQRWVRLIKGIPRYQLCRACAAKEIGKAISGENHPQWRGGRKIAPGGYIMVKLYPDDFFYPMCNKRGYVFEHRLSVAKALGRNLHLWEIVHHKGVKYPKGSIENKRDNRYPENLQLVSDDRHKQISLLEDKIDRLLQGQNELKQEIRLVRLQNKLLRVQLDGERDDA